MKNGKIIFPLVWMIILLGIGIYYFVGAGHTEEYSETENRMLSGVPDIVWSVKNNSLDSDTESYLLDRFPLRYEIINVSNKVRDFFSISTYDDYLQISQGSVDPLDSGLSQTSVDDLLSEVLNPSLSDETVEPEVHEEILDEAPESLENPPIEKKPQANIDDFDEWLGSFMEVDGNRTYFTTYKRETVLAMTAVLNKYAALLPENGKLMFTLVPQATFANQFVNSSHNGFMVQQGIDVIDAFGLDNVYAFDAAQILTDHIKDGEYIFFRTDMHWTPLGSYYVYKEMVERAGKEAADYYGDFEHTIEEPFLGTYYRDNPTDYFLQNPDSLDLLRPPVAHELRRINGVDSYVEIPYLNENAKANDRYTVYLGGPAGPWTYAECDNDEEENALVIMDSFGLGYFTFLTNNYKQVHYYDPRYFDASVVGYSVSEMIEKYDITDIYVVIGDLHSFDSSFIITDANAQY